jgi:alginate export protein
VRDYTPRRRRRATETPRATTGRVPAKLPTLGQSSHRMPVSRYAFTFIGWLLAAMPLGARQAAPETPRPNSTETRLTVRDWTRVEVWRFFEPPPGGGDNEYAYPVNRLQAAVRRSAARYDITAALQYVQFGGLPRNAVGPGPLGLGAVYFSHAGRTDSHQVYLRYLNAEIKNVLPGVGIQVGRMPYSSGAEAQSGDPTIEAVKRQRIDARIVGEFDWSLYQRAFDGVRVDAARPRWTVTGVAVHPTQGGFEDAAGLMMPDVTVLITSATLKPGTPLARTEWQLFAIRYLDDRRVSARPDNSGRSAAAGDLAINTFGTTLVTVSTPRDGRQWDGLVWIAGQTGSWYEQTHRALSIAAEAGHQWSAAPWRPWVRAGVLHASGDDRPDDDRHGTFFQMLPTVRRYAQTAAYSQMNLNEVFVQSQLRPTPSLGVRVDLHRVDLASARDLWYSGSGATQRRGTQFGFAGRPSAGTTGLGTTVEASGDYAITRRWSLNGFVGFMRGGAVVRRSFAGSAMTFAYLENVLQF